MDTLCSHSDCFLTTSNFQYTALSNLINLFQSLRKEFEYKRFDWKMVEELERPRVVTARVAPLITKDNLFAQVVVRMHTKQVVCSYMQCQRGLALIVSIL